jgi:hypothetical protein
MKTLTSLLVAALGLLSAASASAQVLNPARFDDYTHLVHAGFGADAALDLDLGYVRSLTSLVGRPLVIGTRVSLPPFAVEGGDVEAAALSQIGFLTPSGFGVSPRVELGVRNAHTDIVNTTDVGIHLEALSGYFGERVMAAADLAWEKPLSAYMAPTDQYREQGYAGARSGWYSGGGGLFRFGIASGVRIFTNSELTLRAGIVRSEQFHNVDLLPFYAQLGFNQAF